MNKLLIICGPTASGKTSFALSLAKKFNGELVSADSRQVYRGMDVVTGKDMPVENSKRKTQNAKLQLRTKNFGMIEPIMFGETPVWLLNIIEPDQSFSVADYYQLAWEAIDNISKRGKLPILVGGTGFYIKAVADGIGTMGVAPDIELREELSALSVELLGQKLKKLDPKRWEKMNESDRRNPRRLIRAIEVNKYSSSEASAESRSSFRQARTISNEVLWIGLTAEKKILHEKIDRRVDERIRQGAVEETKKLAKQYGWGVPSMSGLGYRQLRQYIEGKISLAEAVDRWKLAEHEYASKQMTWFKKEKRIAWLVVY